MLTFHSPAEFCEKSVNKHCFIAGYLNWCSEHEATSSDSEGTYDLRREDKVRNGDGSEEVKIEIVQGIRCSHSDAREHGVVQRCRIR